ncbi:winged helix DNA-binding protein [Sphingomonas sp. Mn802worker]|uniref:winged helix DNA-binding protein n=1 Tax=Sphingomonas sp. Mn802worker TaxID=629773 RepID=UPI000378C599|nr:winged helix DNA-binding protein [Sphingomonas sp. Mn802worker]
MGANPIGATTGWHVGSAIEPPARFRAIVMGRDAHDADTRSAALDALDAEVVRELPLDADLTALAEGMGRGVMIVDLIGQDDPSIDLLERADALAASRDWPLVVAFPTRHIDPVAAICTRSGTHLLCEPEVAEWIATFAIAAEGNDVGLAERVGESEVARLQRLNSEVARIAEVVARLSRQSEATKRRQNEARVQAFTPPTPDYDISAAQVREVIRARRMRDRFFEGGLFEDPAWDMLLDLLAAQMERGQVSVSSLCIASAVPPTTALRWITRLTDAGLVEREADPFDRRRAFLRLSPDGGNAMHRYVAAVREAKIPFV